MGDEGVAVMLSWNSSSGVNLRPCCFFQKSCARSLQYSSLFPLSLSVCQVPELSIGSDWTPVRKEESITIVTLLCLRSTACFSVLDSHVIKWKDLG